MSDNTDQAQCLAYLNQAITLASEIPDRLGELKPFTLELIEKAKGRVQESWPPEFADQIDTALSIHATRNLEPTFQKLSDAMCYAARILRKLSKQPPHHQ
ncbi:hypothetical protein GC170_02745 [bacterium]|nr:hypothetical protein [bacterium]